MQVASRRVARKIVASRKQDSSKLQAGDLKKAKFVRITSSGINESHPHDMMITKEAPNYSRQYFFDGARYSPKKKSFILPINKLCGIPQYSP